MIARSGLIAATVGVFILSMGPVIAQLSVKTPVDGEIIPATIRTVCVVGPIAAAITFFAFFLAAALALTKSRLNRYLFVLLIPYLLGPIAGAHVGKVFFSFLRQLLPDMSFSLVSWLAYVLIQFWQYGGLSTVIFLVAFKSHSYRESSFLSETLVSFKYSLYAHYFPATRLLRLLISGLITILLFHDTAISWLVFRASPGTNTELLANFLQRTYVTNLSVSATYAMQIHAVHCGMVICCLVILIALNYLLQYPLFSVFCLLLPRFLSARVVESAIPAVMLITCLPLLLPLSAQPSFTAILPALKPMLLAVVVALMVTATSVLISTADRYAIGRCRVRDPQLRAMVFSLSPLLIPVTATVISAFYLVNLVMPSLRGEFSVAWMISNYVFSLPLILALCVYVSATVRQSEIDLFISGLFTYSEARSLLFFTKYYRDYVLVGVFAFLSSFFNQGCNRVFGTAFPNFASIYESRLVGRTADLSDSSGFFISSLVLAFILIVGLFVATNSNRSLKCSN